MSLEHIPETCTRNIPMRAHMVRHCPCYLSPLHVTSVCPTQVSLSQQDVPAADLSCLPTSNLLHQVLQEHSHLGTTLKVFFHALY